MKKIEKWKEDHKEKIQYCKEYVFKPFLWGYCTGATVIYTIMILKAIATGKKWTLK